MAAFDDILAKRWSCQPYRFFHPPLFPGAPPVDRGAGPNSGPDSRELVGWKILVPPPSSDAEQAIFSLLPLLMGTTERS